MKRYNLSIFILLVLLSLAASFTGCADSHSGAAGEALNVMVIMADDLGYETLGANRGGSYQTPKLDHLASNGMRFEHCCAQPLCTPGQVQISVY